MVHIRCDVRKRTEKASDDFSSGSKAVEVEQGVVHAIYAVAAEAAVLIGENPSRECFPKPFLFFHIVGGQIEHRRRISLQFLLHGADKGIRGAFADGRLVVCAADVHADAGRTEAGSDVVDPFLKPLGRNEEVIVFGGIKPFPGKNICFSGKRCHIIWIQTSIGIPVCQNGFVGQIIFCCLLVKEFSRICHGMNAGDFKFGHRLK